MSTDWTTFKQRIHISSPIEELYKCWATPGGIMSWFLESAEYSSANVQRDDDEFIKKGDRFRWKWHNWDKIEKGTILEANGKDRLSFTFGKGGNVDVTLVKEGKGTWVELVQRDIPTDEESKMSYYMGCSTGWTFWLTNLKAWLEHGISLNITGLRQDQTAHLINS